MAEVVVRHVEVEKNGQQEQEQAELEPDMGPLFGSLSTPGKKHQAVASHLPETAQIAAAALKEK